MSGQPTMDKHQWAAWLKVGLFCALSARCVLLVWRLWSGNVPGDALDLCFAVTATWALNSLVLVLAAPILQRLLRFNYLVRMRRMLGLFSYFYASLHLLVYVVFDQVGDLASISHDLLTRPYILLGFCAWLVLTPLALTSTRRWQRRLGRQWKRLHRLVYFVPLFALGHLFWLTKADYTKALVYSLIFLALIAIQQGPRVITQVRQWFDPTSASRTPY